MSLHIDDIIERLGYEGSKCLKYGRDGFNDMPDIPLSAHAQNVLTELSPYAIFFVDNTPLLLFYEKTDEALNTKIWNAQIPVTIVCGSSEVKIYSSSSIDKDTRLLAEVLSISPSEINEDSPFSFWEITDNNFWSNHQNTFSVDKFYEHLLKNLSHITEKLRNDYRLSFASKLVLRLIFIRYLTDRGVNLGYEGFCSTPQVSKDNLSKLMENKNSLYELFAHLKGKFNGNLFELGNEIDDPCLTDGVLKLLSDFLSANRDTETGQLSFFDMYDFNIIPVELISNIYERLMGDEKQRADKAYYTPRFLVDRILDDTMQPFIRDKGPCKVLDPSCGSGIFLVQSYRRMVEHELDGVYTDNDILLVRILTDNIFGIDMNEDAVNVAIFSLYIAVLEYKDPRTLNGFTLPNLKDINLFVENFFNTAALKELEQVPFDFIVGNPPWSSNPGLHSVYLKDKGYGKFKNDTCHGFILRSMDFAAANNALCCFVLNSRMLYAKQSDYVEFRRFLLTNTKIAKILEMSALSDLLFKNSRAPAFVMSFSFSAKGSLENRFEYTSLKPTQFFRLFNMIITEKTDIKFVSQQMLLDKDWAWKTLVYGFSGDIDVVSRLKSDFPTVLQSINDEQPTIIHGAGVNMSDHGDLKDASHLTGRVLLESDAIDHFRLNESKVSRFSKTRIHRTRNETLFHAPYCLIRTGFDTNTYNLYSVYSEADYVFKHAVYAIKGSAGQRPFLLNLTGLLNSNLYAYLNLMLGSYAGLGWKKQVFNEVLEFPFAFCDDIAIQAEHVQKSLEKKQQLHGIPDGGSEETDKLNAMVFKAFGLAGNAFVDYAINIQIPWLANNEASKAFRPANEHDLCTYAQSFHKSFNALFAMSGKAVSTNVYPTVSKRFCAVEVVVNENGLSDGIQVFSDSTLLLETMTEFSAHKANEVFYFQKDVVYFGDDSFCIVKPNYLKNWHPAIAELDLDEVLNDILTTNEE